MDLNCILNQKLINQLSSFIAVLDCNSKFIQMNKIHATTVGYREPCEIIGLGYENFKGKAAERAEQFIQQDKMSITHKASVQFLSFDCFSNNEWLLILVEKTPIYDDQGQCIGIHSNGINLEPLNIIDVSRFLLASQQQIFGKLKKRNFLFQLTDTQTQYQLTKCENIVLFYIIRGKTAKEIAVILCRTTSAVNNHICALKIKFDVNNRSQLVEKAITAGYMNILPEEVFKRCRGVF